MKHSAAWLLMRMTVSIGLTGLAINLAVAQSLEEASTTGQKQTVPSATYVGSQACISCHQTQFEAWQTADHARAMNTPSATTVLGDFSQSPVNFQGIKTEFVRDNNQFALDITAAPVKHQAQTTKRYPIRYTFGYSPLQQYLLETENGKLQAYDVAWDSRARSEGGQRWFSLQSEAIDSEHPFFWTRHFQTANARCIECHVTGFQKNYLQTPTGNRYQTKFSEENVACEACHGPTSRHVQLAKQYQNDLPALKQQAHLGLNFSYPSLADFQLSADARIASVSEKNQKKGEQNARQREEFTRCGGCHSRRTQQIDSNSLDADAGNYGDRYDLQVLSADLYYPDGQVRDEVFVLGSFLQSKMAAAGVTCSHCHDPHSGKVRSQENSLCTSCHQASVYDQKQHHQHENNAGNRCIACHMPQTTYMGVDARRDHQFANLHLATSLALDTPNACLNCHKKSLDEAGKAWLKQSSPLFPKAFNSEHPFADILVQARQANLTGLEPLLNKITINTGESALSSVVRATLLAELPQYPLSLAKVQTTLLAQLQDPSPLVRKAAVEASAALDLEQRYPILRLLLADSSRNVRLAVTKQLVEKLHNLSNDQAAQQALNDYRVYLALSADTVQGQMNYADYYWRLGDVDKTISAYQSALALEDQYIPALLNLADVYRAQQQDDQAEPLLRRALDFAPESGAVQYAYALYLIRQKQLPQALVALKAAQEAADASPRYSYTYALALEAGQQLPAAIAVLESANKRWPNHELLLPTWIQLLGKSADPKDAEVAKLLELQWQQLVKSLQN